LEPILIRIQKSNQEKGELSAGSNFAFSFRLEELDSFLKVWKSQESQLFHVEDYQKIWDSLRSKQKVLQQFVFGNGSIPWNSIDDAEPIFLWIDESLSNCPWELLPWRDKFLFERPHLYRTDGSVKQIGSNSNEFLAIQNPVLPYLSQSMEQELNELEALFYKNKKKGFRILNSPTVAKFWEETLKTSNLHYAGHSESGKINLSDGELYIESKQSQGLGIVFLNSCHSVLDTSESLGLARKFLQIGANCVIGFLGPIPTNVAKKIGILFWEKVWSGQPVENAYHLTKIEATEIFGPLVGSEFLCFQKLDGKSSFVRFLQVGLGAAIALLLLYFTLSKNTDLTKEEIEESYRTFQQEGLPNAYTRLNFFPTEPSESRSFACDKDDHFYLWLQKKRPGLAWVAGEKCYPFRELVRELQYPQLMWDNLKPNVRDFLNFWLTKVENLPKREEEGALQRFQIILTDLEGREPSDLREWEEEAKHRFFQAQFSGRTEENTKNLFEENSSFLANSQSILKALLGSQVLLSEDRDSIKMTIVCLSQLRPEMNFRFRLWNGFFVDYDPHPLQEKELEFVGFYYRSPFFGLRLAQILRDCKKISEK